MADLIESLAEGDGTARRIIPVDPRDLGIASGADAAHSIQKQIASSADRDLLRTA